MDIKLIGAIFSPYVRKCCVLFNTKGIAYEHDTKVSPLALPENYELIHPQKRIPAMIVTQDGQDTTIADSSAICAFAEKLNPAPSFYPDDAVDCGRAVWFEEYADSELGARITLNFFRGVFFRLAAGKEPDWDMVKKGFTELKDIVAYFERELGDKEWLVGDELSIADISLVVHFVNVYHAGFTLEKADSPTVSAYIAKLMALPMITELVAQEEMVLEKMNYQKPDLNQWRREQNA